MEMQGSASDSQKIPSVGVWYYKNVVKSGTRNYPEADELRYSIRSAVAKAGIKKVIIVGDKPSWFVTSENAIYVPSNPPRNPISPIASVPWDHLKKFASSKVYQGEFLLFNDDFFVLRKLKRWSDTYRDPADYKLRVERNLEYHHREMRALYALAMPNGKHYNLHIPMRVNTKNLADAFRLRGRTTYQDLPFKTIYGNMFLKDAVPYADVKNSPDGVFFSSSEQTWKDQKWLRDLFPNKCFCESR